jgi:hypothetical protein
MNAIYGEPPMESVKNRVIPLSNDARKLLRQYVAYAYEFDGVRASHQDHAESLILFALDEHEGFHAWLADPNKFRTERKQKIAQAKLRQQYFS